MSILLLSSVDWFNRVVIEPCPIHDPSCYICYSKHSVSGSYFLVKVLWRKGSDIFSFPVTATGQKSLPALACLRYANQLSCTRILKTVRAAFHASTSIIETNLKGLESACKGEADRHIVCWIGMCLFHRNSCLRNTGQGADVGIEYDSWLTVQNEYR